MPEVVEGTASGTEFQRAVEEARAEQSTSSTERQASDVSTKTAPETAESNKPDTKASTETASTGTDTDLISDTELQALKTKHKDNPDALAKELRGVFTQKTQALAEQRKAVERLTRYEKFVDALETAATPEARAHVLRQAATELGVDLTATAASTETTAATAKSLGDEISQKVTAALGNEYDFLAQPLATALTAAIEPLVKQVESLSSVKTDTEKRLETQARAEVQTTLQAFGTKCPDWQKYEPAMTELGKSILPADGVSPLDHLERLYKLASHDDRVAADVQKALDRMKKGANTTERLMPGVRETQVTETAPAGDGSIKSFFAEAKRELATR